ncbi:MAG TPA: MFS transporter [Candidatus Lokiarchaeia archaeon]|nr:MFS transporter [Candidatus Lokiarchaeia archaeon]
MNDQAIARFKVSMSQFITTILLINALQYLISPGLNTIAKYFGFVDPVTGAVLTSQLGILQSMITIIGGASVIIFGYLSDKIVRVRILLVGSMIYSVSAILVSLVSNSMAGYVLYFILNACAGFGYGMIIPTTFSLIGDLVLQKDRAKGFSFVSIATLLGTAVGFVMGATIIDIDWRLSYFILGLIGLGNGFLTLTIKEPNRAGRDYVLSGNLEREYSYRIRLSDLKVILKKKTNIWLIINFVDTVPTGIIMFLLFKYLLDIHGIPETMSILFLMLVFVSTLVGTIVFGFIGDARFKKGNKSARVHLALIANVVPIPFIFFAFVIPFQLPQNGTITDLFMIPGAVAMILLICIGLFINGATNGCWYATVVDVNLPEHRATVLAAANFFDIVGRSIGPLIGSIVADAFGLEAGMLMSIYFWIAIPFFWIGILQNFVHDMDQTKEVFEERMKNPEK